VPTDDFSLIKGIGPILSKRLHKAGIYTYNQLAVLSPAALAEKVSGLSAKQITRQDWIGQAHKLAPKKTRSKPHRKEVVRQIIRQHYVNFTIEFLLDEKNRIRCTRVVHIQSGDADTWAGWEADQLVDFLARHAGVRIPAKKFESPENSVARRQLLEISDSGSSLIEVKSPAPLHLLSDIRETTQSGTEVIKPVLQSPANTNFAGILRLQGIKVLPTGSNVPVHSLRQDQPYHVRLTLDLTNVVVPSNIPLRYKATINFKQLGGASCLVAEESCTIQLSDCVTLDIICDGLPPGTYRPDAFVRLFSDETDLGLMASVKGDLIQVF
jgi:hypothetical protein